MREQYGRLVRGEIDSFVDERTYVTKHGHRAWVEVSTTAVWDDDGRFLYAVRAIHDVTQRRSAEEALRESEARIRFLVESSAQAVWETDAEVSWSRTARRGARTPGRRTRS